MLEVFEVTNPSERAADIFTEFCLALKDSLYYASYCLLVLTLAQSFSLVPQPRAPSKGGYMKGRLGKSNPRRVYIISTLCFAVVRGARFVTEVWANSGVRTAFRGIMVAYWTITLVLTILLAYAGRKRIILLRPKNIKAAKLKARMSALVQYIYIAFVLTVLFYIAWFVRYTLPDDTKHCDPQKWLWAKLPEKVLEFLILLVLFTGLILRMNFLAQKLCCCCHNTPDELKKGSNLSHRGSLDMSIPKCRVDSVASSPRSDVESIEDVKIAMKNEGGDVQMACIASPTLTAPRPTNPKRNLRWAKSSEALWESVSTGRQSDMSSVGSSLATPKKNSTKSVARKSPSISSMRGQV